jgi:hypothetical protein
VGYGWGIAARVSVPIGIFGGLLWRTGSANRSSCTLPDELGRRFVPGLYDDCQWAKADSRVGFVVLVLAVVVFAVSFGPARKASRQHRAQLAAAPPSPPAGWMRVPVGWRPTNGPFMPVPPGWPQPAADWTAPKDWEPPATWPDPPRGWPRPDHRSASEVRRFWVVARASCVFGLLLVGLDIARPVMFNGLGGVVLAFPALIAFMCLVNLAVSRRHLRMFVLDHVATCAALWGLLYGLEESVLWARLAAFGLAACAVALAIPLRSQRPAPATQLPKNPQQARPQPTPAPDASIGMAPDV